MKFNSLILCFIALFVLSPNSNSETITKCGDNLLVSTYTGYEYEGNLVYKNDLQLMIKTSIKYQKLNLSSIKDIYKFNRKTKLGVLIGSILGLATGIAIGANHDCNNCGIGGAVFEPIAITFGTTLTGGTIGGVIGKSIQYQKKIEIEELSNCDGSFVSFNEFDESTLGVLLAYKF